MNKEVERWCKNTDILSVGFSDEKILINTSYTLICYDHIGNENWRYYSPDAYIIHNVCWNRRRKYWLFILWNNIKGRP